MSLIEEALRRAQDPLLPPEKQSPVPAPDRPAVPERHPAAHPWQGAPARPEVPTPQPQTAPLTAVALAVLLLTIALLIGGAFWMGRALTATPRAGEAPAQVSMTLPAPVLEATPAPPERPLSVPQLSAHANAKAPDLVLSGVIEGSGDSYAMINGLIVTVGERIGDAALEQIGQGSVTLRHDDGRRTILRVPR